MSNVKIRMNLNQLSPSYIDIDKNNGLRSIESLNQSTNSPNELFYGVLPNSGSAKIVDVNGQIKQYIENGLIKNSNLPISIIANNKIVQGHISTDSDYNDLTNTFSMTLGDTLSHWEEMTYQGYAYPDVSKNAYEMLYDVLTSIGYTSNEVDAMLSTNIIYGDDLATGTIKSYLQLITIPYPYLPSDTVRNTIEKFCRLAQLQVYKKDDGKIIFVSARPIATTTEIANAIQIPKNNQYGDLGKSIILKNKYEAVELDVKKVKDEIDYNNIVASYKTTEITNDTNNTAYDSDHYTTLVTQTTFELYSRVYLYYTTITTSFPAKSNYNLETIVKAIEENTQYILKFSDNTSGKITDLNYTYSYYDSVAGRTFNTSVNPTNIETIGSSGTITYDSTNDVFNVSLTVLTKMTKSTHFTETPNGTEYPTRDLTLDSQSITAVQVEISFYGDKRVISLEDISASDKIVTESSIVSENITSWEELGSDVDYYRYAFYPNDISQYQQNQKIYFENEEYIIDEIDTDDDYFAFAINNSSKLYAKITNQQTQSITFTSGIVTNNIASVGNSELLQSGTMYNNSIKMSTLIKNNIKSDYANGIATAKMTMPCVDYYNSSQTKVKNWQNGDVIETHDVVNLLNTDNANWRVTSRTFRKDGVPMIDTQLQEIKTN